MQDQQKKEIAASLSVKLTPQLTSQLEKYFREIIRWKKKVNICGRMNEDIFWLKHVADAWLARELLGGKERAADIGSGAGFPGIPLKLIFPNLKLTLFEKNYKKEIFLRDVISVLGIKECSVIRKKIEKKATFNEKDYDIILIRALKVDEDIESGLRLIAKRKAKILLFNGPHSTSARTLEDKGWALVRVKSGIIPVYQHERKICVFEKCST